MPEKILDGDCDWYCVDARGQVALFTSAGSEYVPKYYFPRLDLLTEIGAVMENLPETTQHSFVAEKRTDLTYSSWTDASERGLFGYDFDLQTGSWYKLICAPNSPLLASALPIKVSSKLPLFQGVFG